MQFRTDLAIERYEALPGQQGVEKEEESRDGIDIHRVHILTEEAAQNFGKDRGKYVTLSNTRLSRADLDRAEQEMLARTLAEELETLLPNDGCVMVVGLGNRHITADALGSRVVEKLLVTRQMALHPECKTVEGLRSVCAVSPGVLGITGIETAEMIRGVTDRVRPSAVIAIDALAAREVRRICTTVQMTDTGISPGSGVGNHRMGLNVDTLGVPVIAIGVPMVVYAGDIVRDALSLLVDDLDVEKDASDQAVQGMVRHVTEQTIGEMVVTPREVDELVGRVAGILALGINLALQKKLGVEDILLLTNDHL